MKDIDKVEVNSWDDVIYYTTRELNNRYRYDFKLDDISKIHMNFWSSMRELISRKDKSIIIPKFLKFWIKEYKIKKRNEKRKAKESEND